MVNPMLPVSSHSVSVFLLRPDGQETQVLLMRRMGTLEGLWCQVAGGIEPGEKAWQTALREVREETGIQLDELWSADVLEQFYEPERECIALVPVFVGLVPAGTQVVLNDEHDAYQWVSFAEASELLSFSGQREVLSAVKREFVDKAPNPYLKIIMDL